MNREQTVPFVARHENSPVELGNTELLRVDSGVQLHYQTLLSLTELGSEENSTLANVAQSRTLE